MHSYPLSAAEGPAGSGELTGIALALALLEQFAKLRHPCKMQAEHLLDVRNRHTGGGASVVPRDRGKAFEVALELGLRAISRGEKPSCDCESPRRRGHWRFGRPHTCTALR